MHTPTTDLPVKIDAPGAHARQLPDFGTATATLAAEYFTLGAGADLAPLLEGLEHDACQSAHWGYVVTGAVVVTYTDGTDEACSTGDVFHWPPGHSVRVIGRRRAGDVQPRERPSYQCSITSSPRCPAAERHLRIGTPASASATRTLRGCRCSPQICACVMIIIDAMPHRHLDPVRTPRLWEQAANGGRAPDGGRSLPMSVTYANHAAFVTGADPATTGVYGNHTWIDGEGWVSAPKAGPRATTLFDLVADAGGRSVTVVGDHKLIAQMGGARADHHWPPDGWIPDGTPRCEFGYPADAAVVAAAAAADLDADLVVLHLNQPDTTSHLHGPDSEQALDQYSSTDAAYGRTDRPAHRRMGPHRRHHGVGPRPGDDHRPDAGAARRGARRIQRPQRGDRGDRRARPRTGRPASTRLAARGRRCRRRGAAQRRRVDGLDPTGARLRRSADPASWANTAARAAAHSWPSCPAAIRTLPRLARRIEATRPSALDWAPTVSRLLEIGPR